VKVLDRENIEIRIWERGAGETSASGTCASAAAVLSAYTRRTERAVTVHAEGGATEVFWRDGDEISRQWRSDRIFEPKMSRTEAGRLMAGWTSALSSAKQSGNAEKSRSAA
jgi:diaminopimelate epimerase